MDEETHGVLSVYSQGVRVSASIGCYADLLKKSMKVKKPEVYAEGEDAAFSKCGNLYLGSKWCPYVSYARTEWTWILSRISPSHYARPSA